jgi:hypothetical protein
MGYHDPSGGGGGRLLADYLRHAGRVRELYGQFFPVGEERL